ncbi:phosphatase 2C-like domain-containing protein [Mycena amicta]|nr:phosphatase 2C-like domain-containing protein [Mycena amicta]
MSQSNPAAPEFKFETRQVGGIHVASLPSKGEDRTIIHSFDGGTLIAIFDGHHSDELSQFASECLPQCVANAFDPNDEGLEKKIVAMFQDFDQSLIASIHGVIGIRGDPQFAAGRLAVVGTTVLMAIINKAKDSVWVVSLGDSYAGACAFGGILLACTEHPVHNASNADKVQRLCREHPDEENLVVNVHGPRVLGWLGVTRALGDYQLKVDRAFAKSILSYFYPGPVPGDCWEIWAKAGNNTPPYLSCIPTVKRFDLLAGDLLVLSSDGLPDSMNWIDVADRWKTIVNVAHGKDDSRLGHGILRPTGEHNVNEAELLIRNALFGDDGDKMAKEFGSERDNISVVVVRIEELV